MPEEVNGHAHNGTSVEETGPESFGYFSAGPSKLPHDVMLKAQKEFLNYGNSRVSVMELSHRLALLFLIALERGLKQLLTAAQR